MAHFEWITRRIDLRNPPSPTWRVAELTGPSCDAQLAITLSHEYVHYLQIVSSLPGLRLLGDMVSFAVKGAITLAGAPSRNGKIIGYHKILALLEAQPDRAGVQNADIVARAEETLDEANVLLEPHSFDYTGAKRAWEVDRQEISYKTYVEPVHGIVVPGPNNTLRFRPLSPGMLAEAMARRIDRWINETERYGHRWSVGEIEDQHYNGLMNVLSQRRFDGIVDGGLIEHLVVIICHLALGTPRPDERGRDPCRS